jgi:hypothetical protein
VSILEGGVSIISFVSWGSQKITVTSAATYNAGVHIVQNHGKVIVVVLMHGYIGL